MNNTNIYKRPPLGMMPNGKKYRAVIVDDSVTARAHLKMILNSVHFDVIDEIDNGGTAAEKLKKHEIHPDFIFIDIEMPVLDGVSLVKEIKPFVPDCKIVMITSSSKKEQVEMLVKLGVQGYIKKPFDREVFISRLSKIFGYKD